MAMKLFVLSGVVLVTIACGSAGPDRGLPIGSSPTGLNIDMADEATFAGSFVSSGGIRLTFRAGSDGAKPPHAMVESPSAPIASVESRAEQDAPDIAVTPLEDPETRVAANEMLAELVARYQGKQGSEAAHALYVAAGLLRASDPTLDSAGVFRALIASPSQTGRTPDSTGSPTPPVQAGPAPATSNDCICLRCFPVSHCWRAWAWDCNWPGTQFVLECDCVEWLC
jgi:hypothetical protein